jgi:hypothetical protein
MDTMTGVTMRGLAAELRVGYQLAAQLSGWEMTGNSAAWTLTAAVASRDCFWMDQRPLELRLTVGKATWRWRGVDVSEDGTRITVMGAGRPEVR